MLLNAQNGSVKFKDVEMDYISFGNGKQNLLLIPGLGDAFTTVKGKASTLALGYKAFAKDFTVYVFSRKNNIKEKYTTKEMAKDYVQAMKQLGIQKAHIIGVSQGGMIAQYIAIDFPQVVTKLILVVTLSKQNEIIKKKICEWITFAKEGNYRELFIDTVENSYSTKYLKKYRFLYPILTRVGKPKDFTRFLIQADACIQHNAYEELEKILCKTLIIGGGKDQIVGAYASEELAKRIKNSELIIYKELGHGVYEEAKDFNERVLKFLV